jgi:hypothetical protein
MCTARYNSIQHLMRTTPLTFEKVHHICKRPNTSVYIFGRKQPVKQPMAPWDSGWGGGRIADGGRITDTEETPPGGRRHLGAKNKSTFLYLDLPHLHFQVISQH